MKIFKFKLDKVLIQRKIAADIAIKDFSEAQAARDLEQKKLNDMIALLQKTHEDRARIVHNTIDWANSVDQINTFIQGQDLRIKNQHLRLQRAENLVESRREILREKVSEVKILERLQEKQKQKYMSEVAKTEQAEMDEISVMRFSRIENPTKESPTKESHEDGL